MSMGKTENAPTTPIVLTCGVCERKLGERDAAIGDSCPTCQMMRPVHARCQALPCGGCHAVEGAAFVRDLHLT